MSPDAVMPLPVAVVVEREPDWRKKFAVVMLLNWHDQPFPAVPITTFSNVNVTVQAPMFVVLKVPAALVEFVPIVAEHPDIAGGVPPGPVTTLPHDPAPCVTALVAFETSHIFGKMIFASASEAIATPVV